MKQLLLFLFLSLALSSVAQETVELKGKILNEFQIIEGVTVVNLRTDRATVSNEIGHFKLAVAVGDTLEMAAVHFETEKVVVSAQTYEKGTYDVYLIPKINELNEVWISNSFMNGFLERDANSLVIDPSKINYNPDSANPISAERRRLYSARAKHSPIDNNLRPTLAISLDGLINTFSGKTKRLREHVAVSEYTTKIKDLRSFYADKMFTETLNIPLNRIDDFLMYLFQNAIHLDRILHYNKLEILSHLEKRSSDYLAILEQERLTSDKG